MQRYARVSANIPQLSGLFDYFIPDHLMGIVQPGSLVTIPFGRQTVQGIVVCLLDEPSVEEIRSIESALLNESALAPHQIELAGWMAHENLSTLSQNLDLMLPQGLSQQADILITLLAHEQVNDFNPMQSRIVAILQKRGELRGRQMDAALPRTSWRESLPGMVKRGLVSTRHILPPPSVRPKVVRTALFFAQTSWRDDPSVSLGRAGSPSRQRREAVLAFLEKEAIPVNVSWVYAETGASSTDLYRLAELGLILLGETELLRDPLSNLKPVFASPPELTPDQSAAWKRIHETLSSSGEKKPILLEGVTGSGKTELYLKAAEQALQNNRGVFILVPEISLTPQTVKRFHARFPGKVGIIHSQLSAGEKYDTWRRIRAGTLEIVVGPRSALFTPLVNPGLIIIDECHDSSYHQEDFTPCYHTIETSIAYAGLTNSVLILGSATPGVELLYQFGKMKWPVLKLPKRVLAFEDSLNTPGGITSPKYKPLPEVDIVDMRSELAAGNRSALSRNLQAEIHTILSRGEQGILFLNRRGSASYIFCRECGYVLRCPRCDTQLTFHASETSLICHTCNYRRQLPSNCPSCRSAQIRQFGMGTESLEKLVVETYPGVRVVRWDADSARYKGAHDLILDHFTQHRADILIGTQMLAKGLDLPLVTLVGVVLADISLNLPDFRAAERTYQLLTQVAGRAGRSARGGKVVLQTFQPDHYAITSAAAYDTAGFYDLELKSRQLLGYPPFSRLLKVEFRHTDPEKARAGAEIAGEQLRNIILVEKLKGISLIGPVPCFYQRRSGYFRWQILVRSAQPQNFLESHPLSAWQPPGIQIRVTMDPVNLL